MLAMSIDVAEKLFQSVEEAYNCSGRHLNPNKTKTQLMNKHVQLCETYEGTPLENTNDSNTLDQ